nr:MAG TPA: hypothetical protein [Caudoviricetes sp.]
MLFLCNCLERRKKHELKKVEQTAVATIGTSAVN